MSFSGDVFEPSSSNAKQRAILVEWLNSLLPNLGLPINASDEELRLFLVDGAVLCQILNKLKPGSVTEQDGSPLSSDSVSENAKRFLLAVEKTGLPRFPLSDLEKGSMKIVLEWLLTLRTEFMPTAVGYSFSDSFGSQYGSDASSNGSSRSSRVHSPFQRSLRSPVMAEPSAALIHHVGHKFHEVFQLKQGHYADLPAARISEMMKSNSLDNAPTQSLLSVVNGILDESIERKNAEIPHRVACLLRKVVQEIERRISTQAEHLRTQNNLFKAREEKYQSRIRVLEALATGTSEETQIVKNQLQQMQSEKNQCNDKKKVEEQDMARLMREKDDHNHELANLKQDYNREIASLKQNYERETAAMKQDYDHKIANLKQELETVRRYYEQQDLNMDTESKGSQQEREERLKEAVALKQDYDHEIATLKQELEILRKSYEQQCLEMKTESRGSQQELEERLKEAVALKHDSDREITTLKQELETLRKSNEQHCLEMKTESRGSQQELEERLKEALAVKQDSDCEIATLKKELKTPRKSNEQQCLEMKSESRGSQQELEEMLKEAVALKQDSDREIATLKQELETLRKSNEQQCLEIKTESRGSQHELNERLKEALALKQDSDREIATLKQELETLKRSYGQQCLDMKAESTGSQQQLEERLKEAVALKQDSDREIATLKQELENLKKRYEQQCLEMKTESEGPQQELEEKLNEAVILKQDHDREIANLKQELENLRKYYEQQQMKPESRESQQELEEKLREAVALKQDCDREIANLKQELENLKKHNEQQYLEMKTESRGSQKEVEEKLKEAVALKQDRDREIATLKQELENLRKSYEQQCFEMRSEFSGAQQELEEKLKESVALKQDRDCEIATLKQELETLKKHYEQQCLEMKTESRGAQQELEGRLKEAVAMKQDCDHEIASLKQEIETVKKHYEQQCLEMEAKSREAQKELEEKLKEAVALKQDCDHEIATLKREIETARKNYEQQCLEMKAEHGGVQQQLEERLNETLNLLTESRNRVKELESLSESAERRWSKKEKKYQALSEVQLGALHELRSVSESIKEEVTKTQKSYLEESNHLGLKLKSLERAAASYYTLLAENQKLHNELQELKGNIRVYCRIRPFLPGQKDKQSTIEYVGENGELVVANPSKQGKESRKSFKFNKVYGPIATQADVFSDIQPLIQSVLDGYNVCIFAYGQTGSGKTYTMTGPDKATEEDWGVNYRALNNLFRISQAREGTYSYEVSVQMVEIYNEQVRDLLSSDGSQKRLGILTSSQPNGLAVPDASMYPVKQTADVLHLMDIGLKNRAKSSTALNERSSRSHSIVTIHIRTLDQKSGSSTHSSLHLVDLAGSERVDRSEVTGDRLKEAQHINKSLAALGDVIYALAQKSTHVPYRNSKLTQLLQSSLGGQAKTLMFVQLNPDSVSYSESLSTLKFAERVSGVELGAAKSTKDGRDVRELMEQVTSLKETIGKKDEEIERLQLQKHGTNTLSDVNDQEGPTETSDSALSVGTETDGSAESNVAAKPSPDNAPRTRTTSKVARTPERSPKEPTGLRKSASGNLTVKSSSRK